MRERPFPCRGALLLLAGAVAAGAASAAVPRDEPPAAPPAPAAGTLLVAASQQRGPFFQRTVVLLLEHGASGSLGLIVNRPTEVRLAALLPGEPALAARDDSVWLGGPVGQASVWVLFRGAPPPGPGGPDAVPPPSDPVLPGVRASRSPETLRALLAAQTPASALRVYAGYAGWGPGQLAGEIARGDWHLAEGDAEWIFERPAAEVWPLLVRRSEGLRVRAPRGPGAAPQRSAITYAIHAGSSGACSRRVNTPLPSLVRRSVPSQ